MKDKQLNKIINKKYEYGFKTDIETQTFKKGLNESVIRKISKEKNEPKFMLDFRLKAYQIWQKMPTPEWPKLSYPDIDFQNIHYFD